MSNPPKQKGTGGETELLRLLRELMPERLWQRAAVGAAWDLETYDGRDNGYGPITILATRPDHGQWLLAMPLEQWANGDRWAQDIRVEVKRHARFAHHSIFESKFGGKHAS